MAVQIQRINTTNPTITGINDRVAQQIKGAVTNPAAWWDINDLCMTGTSENEIETVILPVPPSMPRQIVSGAQWPIETSALGSVTYVHKTYATGLEIDKFNYMNPRVGDIHDWARQCLASYADEHLRLIAGQVMATNPTLTYYDNVAMFSASHPVSPFNPSKVTPGGSTTWSNLFTSTAFNITSLYSTINSIYQLAWPNGVPFKPQNFKIWLPSGIDYIKSAHQVYGPMIGANLKTLDGSTADVGSSTNPLESLKRKLGVSIEIYPIPEYATVSGSSKNTDWFVSHELINPIAMFIRQPHRLIDSSGDADFSMFYHNRRQTKLEADLHVGWTHPLAMFKCTA